MTGIQAVGLFSGIGGIELGLHRAGVDTTAMCEIDPRARTVLAHRFPGTPIFHDVREVTGDRLRDIGAVPERTILTGGFPCQDLSGAGRRAGLDHGTRSGLFWEIIRILGEFPAAWVLLENVPGLLSAVCPCPGDGSCAGRGPAVRRGRVARCPGELHTVPGGACRGGCVETHGGAMGAVLGALGDLGYGFAYRVLDSQHLGVPQRRQRVYIVGRRAGGPGWTAPAQVLLEPESGGGHPAAREPARQDPPPGTAGGAAGPRRVSPTVTAKWAKGTGGPAGDEVQNLVVGALTSSMAGGGGGADDNTAQAGHLVTTFVKARRAGESSDYPETWTAGGPAPTLTAGENHSDVRATVLTVLGDVAHTLTSEGSDASEDGTGRSTPIIAARPTTGEEVGGSVVRRLTPL